MSCDEWESRALLDLKKWRTYTWQRTILEEATCRER